MGSELHVENIFNTGFKTKIAFKTHNQMCSLIGENFGNFAAH